MITVNEARTAASVTYHVGPNVLPETLKELILILKLAKVRTTELSKEKVNLEMPRV